MQCSNTAVPKVEYHSFGKLVEKAISRQLKLRNAVDSFSTQRFALDLTDLTY